YVDAAGGAADLFMDGRPIGRWGRRKAERLEGLGGRLFLAAPAPREHGISFSNIRISPWNGQLPRAEKGEGNVLLANGDATAGSPGILREGKLTFETNIGSLEFPIERVQMIDFGRTEAPLPCAARLRLFDGSILNVERFSVDGADIGAHSGTLGDLKV